MKFPIGLFYGKIAFHQGRMALNMAEQRAAHNPTVVGSDRRAT